MVLRSLWQKGQTTQLWFGSQFVECFIRSYPYSLYSTWFNINVSVIKIVMILQDWNNEIMHTLFFYLFIILDKYLFNPDPIKWAGSASLKSVLGLYPGLIQILDSEHSCSVPRVSIIYRSGSCFFYLGLVQDSILHGSSNEKKKRIKNILNNLFV